MQGVIGSVHVTSPVLLVALTAGFSLVGFGANAPATAMSHKIPVVVAENEYGSVAAQVGRKYVKVASVESNPNTDPHTYEVSPRVAKMVSGARLVIQNGLGYDAFMSKLESASPNAKRHVISAQHLLGLPDNTSNPHLWYGPQTMPKVARKIAWDLSIVQPSHAAYFKANARKFTSSLNPWLRAIAQFKAKHNKTPVATTEPVADYMLQAAGANNKTPFTLQADIMNGTDPAPQLISYQENLLSQRKVKVFIYNQQVTDSLTQTFINDAKKAHIPIVGVYETMPVPGYNYQSWMLSEVTALKRAVVKHISTVHL